jgi:hypothetical protein
MGDYWGGNGRRWDNDAGCLFAYYSTDTTLRDIVDGWVNDFCAGGDCDTLPDEVTESDVRAAIIGMLTDKGRDDYASGAVCEQAVAYAEANGFEAGVPQDDQEDECSCDESPVCIILIECELCSECGAWADFVEVADGELCADCAAKRNGVDRDDCANADDDEAFDDCDDCTDCENCAVKHGYSV